MALFLTLQKHYKFFLFSIFIAAWAMSAWHPGNKQNWFAENTLLFICLPITVGLSMRYIQLSKLSYALITAFLILHIIGSHYGYASVPFGATLGSLFWVGGNIYDKFVHFSFGLLMLYPLREFLIRMASIKDVLSYLLPYIGILGLSAAYEIFEWLAVLRLDPHVGYLFIGGSDPFDTSKDMFMAGTGALISLLIIIGRKKLFHKDMYGE